MISSTVLTKNRLLRALPEEHLAVWAADMEMVELPLGQSIYEPSQTLRYAYFPTTSIISILYVMENGASADIAVVGNEGVVGVSLFMGGGSTLSRGVVQSAGECLRLRSDYLTQAFEDGGAIAHLLLRYTQALMSQMLQTAACNRHHTVDQQLCRWLLPSLDRLAGNELQMTLGVCREGVTEAATKLQKAGYIRYARGRITVLDRPGVERCTCECYRVVKEEYERLLPRREAS